VERIHSYNAANDGTDCGIYLIPNDAGPYALQDLLGRPVRIGRAASCKGCLRERATRAEPDRLMEVTRRWTGATRLTASGGGAVGRLRRKRIAARRASRHNVLRIKSNMSIDVIPAVSTCPKCKTRHDSCTMPVREDDPGSTMKRCSTCRNQGWYGFWFMGYRMLAYPIILALVLLGGMVFKPPSGD
jgi:hypothetical protein